MAGRFLELAYRQIRAQTEESGKPGEAPDGISLQFQNLEMQNIPQELLEVLNSQVLKLSFNHNLLRNVPPLPNLSRLFYLDLSENRLGHVPLAICELRSLEILDLSQNYITRVPRDLANLQSLKVLSLSQNKLHYLPYTLTSLKSLEYLEVDDNPLVFPGEDVLRLAQEQDDWLPSLLQHLTENRDKIDKLEQSLAANEPILELHEPPRLERSRSSSEGYLHNRNKRMGFVMQRNTSGSSYMAGLHARGLSVDSVLIDTVPDAQTRSLSLSDRPIDAQRTPSLTSLSDPGVSPRGSPLVVNSSAVAASDDEEKESPVSSTDATGNRLFTLQEEEADEPAEVVPKVPQKSQNRSRVNSAATSHAPHAEPPVPPLMPSQPTKQAIPGYQKLFASLNGFIDAAGNLPLPGNPRFTALMADCQESIKTLEKALEQERDLAGSSHRAITAALDLIAYLNLPPVLNQLVQDSAIGPVRSLILQLVHSFAELSNANSELKSPSPTSQQTPEPSNELRGVQNSGLAQADEQLYQQLEHAVKTLQGVVSLFNTAIARSATVSAQVNGAGGASTSENAGLAAYVGELSSACIDCVSMTRQLKQSLDHRSERGILDRRGFWEDVNSFLKSIVTLLAAAKSAVVDIPLLADSGAEMSALARVAKEVPPLLEQSSYRLHLDAGARLERPKMPMATPSSSTPTVTTPFIAALGTAATEILSPGLQTPFEGGPL